MVAAVSANQQDDNNGNGAPLKVEHKGDMEQKQGSTVDGSVHQVGHGEVKQGSEDQGQGKTLPGKQPVRRHGKGRGSEAKGKST